MPYHNAHANKLGFVTAYIPSRQKLNMVLIHVFYRDSGPPENPDYPKSYGNLSCSFDLFALRRNIPGTAKETPATLQKANFLEQVFWEQMITISVLAQEE
jgi:hypothetical protein